MKNKKFLDISKRKLNNKLENNKYILKSLYKNNKILKTVRWNSLTNLSEKNKSNNLVSRCIFSGQKKKINPLFNISRSFFLRLARNGFINGLKKSTW